MKGHSYRARWHGADYPASPEASALEVWLRLRSDEPAEGFTEVEEGCHVMPVPATACEAVWYVTTVCRWRGVECHVHDEREGELLLEYLGGSAPEAAALGMERIERGVYRRWVPVAEVEDLQEHAVPLAL
ncbi:MULTISPECIES: hypothetical protein [Nonomuraea]|uniref:Uncharacterized protein n=2 Tax=Nonomuraea TaxID=83681 RepID=A0A7W5V6F7_9ACTN|nr:hypothetical protein [Nonomuraea dietziae]MBB3729989.1 hypothetical protein [Nonomuraea dietziae]